MKRIAVLFVGMLAATSLSALPVSAQLLSGDGPSVSVDVDIGGNSGEPAGGNGGSLVDGNVNLNGARGADGQVQVLTRDGQPLGTVTLNAITGAGASDPLGNLEASLGISIGLGGAGGGGGSAGPGAPGGAGGGGSMAAGVSSCTGADGQRLVNIVAKGRVDPAGWARASSVQLMPVKVCADVKSQVRRSESGKLAQLQVAAAADPLIAAPLGRGNSSPGDVFAVQQHANQLMVYVC